MHEAGVGEFEPPGALPRLRQALADLARIAGGADPSRCQGLVVFSLVREAALLRLAPEAVARLSMQITDRLRAALRPVDRLYVLDEWEWLILLPHLPSSAPVHLAMLKFRRTFYQPPLAIGGIELGLNAVCGAALSPEHGEDPLHLVQSARIAALAASQNGEWVALYDPCMEQESVAQRSLVTELQHDLADNALALFLQPQVEVATGRCVHAEALLRWQRHGGDWVQPPLIMATIERGGLRHTFNRWLFQTAALTLAQLRDAGVPVDLSINVTANDLLDPEMPDLIAQALTLWHLPPQRLCVEITETVAVEESQEVADVLHRLRSLGVRLAIDDFGTGYAGMSYLQQLPVHEVKVDRRFVMPIAESPRDREILRSITGLARTLGLRIVAEGVETREVMDLLGELGCTSAQGYLHGRALPLHQFIAWWHAHEGGEG
ncbi:putative bifunctional diguanylate cyclase/phosphodiesterase [Thauera sinica]|uniref:Bifunctional diguanylate cyclase/phosphodiesterase n=1 Tax=Thauera sinica TaxID=2665146 RepID=A0ABW1ASN5_9RHOO|nr:GGDEF domain-containing phosphodiesterase [Thauera sp. K11]ATE61523.1 GGDEF domain-containing protein [Thauera sp. K11]